MDPNLAWLAWSPEILLTFCALGVIAFDLFVPETKEALPYLALGSIIAAMALSAYVAMNNATLYGVYFDGAMRLDAMTTYGRLLFGFVGVLIVLASWNVYDHDHMAEYFGLFMLSLVGEAVIVSGQSLLMLFIGIELLAIPTYALTAILKRQDAAVEAGLKYFLLGMFASVVMLYGVALLYGSLGTVSYIQPLFIDPKNLVAPMRQLVMFGFFFFFMGMGFKIVAFPFHFWSPDVYAGGSTPVVAYISTVPKVAITIALFRVLGPDFAAMYPAGRYYIAALAMASMIYGNVVALQQTDIRRLLAYSGIANTGYALIALAAGGNDSYSAALFFLVLYTFTNLGAFFVVLALSGQGPCTLDDFVGLGKRAPLLAFAMAIYTFSLAGTPPLAGFFGKFALFRSAVLHDAWWLMLVGVLMTVVSVVYYLRIAQQMYGSEGRLAEAPGAALAKITVDRPLMAALVLTFTATLLLGIVGLQPFTGILG